MLTAERLREVLHYNPLTGVFTWLVQRKRARRGAVAGTPNGQGYRKIRIDGRPYRAARLAWFYVHGRWPVNKIDHINTIRDDDRLCNLREATDNQSAQNQKRHRDSTHDLKGVYWSSRELKWWAKISVDGRCIRLGRFATAEEAHAAYCAAARQYHGEFAPFA